MMKVSRIHKFKKQDWEPLTITINPRDWSWRVLLESCTVLCMGEGGAGAPRNLLCCQPHLEESPPQTAGHLLISIHRSLIILTLNDPANGWLASSPWQYVNLKLGVIHGEGRAKDRACPQWMMVTLGEKWKLPEGKYELSVMDAQRNAAIWAGWKVRWRGSQG